MAQRMWSRADKEMIGTNLHTTHLWFTVAGGLLTEIYGPRIDIPQVRGLDFLIVGENGLAVSLACERHYRLSSPGDGIPAVIAEHHHALFQLRLRIAPDPHRDVVLVDVEFEGTRDQRLFAVLSPRIGESGKVDRASVSTIGLQQALWGEQGPFALALMGAVPAGGDAIGQACIALDEMPDSPGFEWVSEAGLMQETREITSAPARFVCEISPVCTLAVAIGETGSSTATLARSSLVRPFDAHWEEHVENWNRWHETYRLRKVSKVIAEPEVMRCLRASTLVLKAHRDRRYPGASIASMSIPWGETSSSPGGYHLVWPRDLVETATCFLAIGNIDHVRQTLCYLIATQQPDGRWHQNQWLGGTPFWDAVQLDEAAFPVLLAGLLDERGAREGLAVESMVRRALNYILTQGPVTCQDRWEENTGLNAFTLAVVIAALIEGSRFVDQATSRFCAEMADDWNALLDQWLWTQDSKLSSRHSVAGHYVRIAPPAVLNGPDGLKQTVQIHNRSDGMVLEAREHVALDFLQLVRYGLRAPDDPRILATLKVADAELGVDTPSGRVWHRYNFDGYGEKNDGSPYDGTGIGRGWPLLSGEMGHYALAAKQNAQDHLKAMARMAGSLGLLPEQVWDEEPNPARSLSPGRPTGGAMPLVWAHAEFIKLAASCASGVAIDRPERVVTRYGGRVPLLSHALWHYAWPQVRIPSHLPLRMVFPGPATVHWGVNGWQRICDSQAITTSLGVAYLDLDLPEDVRTMQFTVHWANGQWDGRDFQVERAD